MKKVHVLFVCLGNICRSPTAHGVFASLVEREGLADRIEIDSAGTGDWHIGHKPDRRASAAAATRGYSLDTLRARQVNQADFEQFDYILAMDQKNLADLRQLSPTNFKGSLGLFLGFGSTQDVLEVPDPYYGGDDGFEHVLDLVEDAASGLLETIKKAQSL